ncbi:THUMP domain-containing protein 1 [Mactra antiquata]
MKKAFGKPRLFILPYSGLHAEAKIIMKSGEQARKGKKRSKAYYMQCAAGGKKFKSAGIEPGSKGFLITCNKYESETVREMYNILNEYADKIYGPEKIESSNQQSVDGDECSDDEDDVEKAMAKETAALKQTSTQERRFKNILTKTKNVIFIKTTLDNPCDLIHKIFEEMYENQVQKARYAQRIIPVSITCKVDTKAINTALHTVLKPHFETPFGVGVKYTAICKIRNNDTISRNVLLPMLNNIIQELNPLHQLCHDEPELVIVIEVMRAVCCLSVVKDYFKFRKYNFHEIVRKTGTDNPNTGSGEGTEAADGISEVNENCDNASVKNEVDSGVSNDKIGNEATPDNVKCLKSDSKCGNIDTNSGVTVKTEDPNVNETNETVESLSSEKIAGTDSNEQEAKDPVNDVKSEKAEPADNV